MKELKLLGALAVLVVLPSITLFLCTNVPLIYVLYPLMGTALGAGVLFAICHHRSSSWATSTCVAMCAITAAVFIGLGYNVAMVPTFGVQHLLFVLMAVAGVSLMLSVGVMVAVRAYGDPLPKEKPASDPTFKGVVRRDDYPVRVVKVPPRKQAYETIQPGGGNDGNGKTADGPDATKPESKDSSA